MAGGLRCPDRPRRFGTRSDALVEPVLVWLWVRAGGDCGIQSAAVGAKKRIIPSEVPIVVDSQVSEPWIKGGLGT